MSNVWYYGKDCEFFAGQWERGDLTIPVLVFCKHKNNPENQEGNCRADICPLGLKPENPL